MVKSPKTISWQLVRTTGNLTVLTNVSYTALFLVPILASVWGPLSTLLNEFFQWLILTNTKAIQLIEPSSSQPHKPQLLSQLEPILTTLNLKLKEQLQDIQNNYAITKALPYTLLCSFIASFLVLIGHFLYQTRCHKFVQDYSLLEFQSFKKDLFLKGQSEGQLENAEYEIRKAIKKDWLTREEAVLNREEGYRLDTIEQGATVEYYSLCCRSRLSCWSSFLLYVGGIGLILGLLIHHGYLIYGKTFVG